MRTTDFKITIAGDAHFQEACAILDEVAGRTPDLDWNPSDNNEDKAKGGQKTDNKAEGTANRAHMAYARISDDYAHTLREDQRTKAFKTANFGDDGMPRPGRMAAELYEKNDMQMFPSLLTPRTGINNTVNNATFHTLSTYQPGKIVPINFFEINGQKLAQSGAVDEKSQASYFASVFDQGFTSVINVIDTGPTTTRAAHKLKPGELITITDERGPGYDLTVECIGPVLEGAAATDAIGSDYGRPNIRTYRLTGRNALGEVVTREVKYIGFSFADSAFPLAEELREKTRALDGAVSYLSSQEALSGGCLSNCSEGMNRSAGANITIAYTHLLNQKMDELLRDKPKDQHAAIIQGFRAFLDSPVMAGGTYRQSDLVMDKLRLHIDGQVIKACNGRMQNLYIARDLSAKLTERKLEAIEREASMGAGMAAEAPAVGAGWARAGGIGAAANGGAGAGHWAPPEAVVAAGGGDVGAAERMAAPRAPVAVAAAAVPAATRQLFIKLVDGRSISLDIDFNLTVGDLVARLKKENSSLSDENYKFIVSGKAVAPETILADIGLQNGTAYHILPSRRAEVAVDREVARAPEAVVAAGGDVGAATVAAQTDAGTGHLAPAAVASREMSDSDRARLMEDMGFHQADIAAARATRAAPAPRAPAEAVRAVAAPTVPDREITLSLRIPGQPHMTLTIDLNLAVSDLVAKFKTEHPDLAAENNTLVINGAPVNPTEKLADMGLGDINSINIVAGSFEEVVERVARAVERATQEVFVADERRAAVATARAAAAAPRPVAASAAAPRPVAEAPAKTRQELERLVTNAEVTISEQEGRNLMAAIRWSLMQGEITFTQCKELTEKMFASPYGTMIESSDELRAAHDILKQLEARYGGTTLSIRILGQTPINLNIDLTGNLTVSDLMEKLKRENQSLPQNYNLVIDGGIVDPTRKLADLNLASLATVILAVDREVARAPEAAPMPVAAAMQVPTAPSEAEMVNVLFDSIATYKQTGMGSLKNSIAAKVSDYATNQDLPFGQRASLLLEAKDAGALSPDKFLELAPKIISTSSAVDRDFCTLLEAEVSAIIKDKAIAVAAAARDAGATHTPGSSSRSVTPTPGGAKPPEEPSQGGGRCSIM